jgi:hypothetical protein
MRRKLLAYNQLAHFPRSRTCLISLLIVSEKILNYLDDVIREFCFQDDVCVETDDGLIHCKLIAVPAGLKRDKNVEEQLNFLRVRDTRVPKVEALSRRKNVWDIPKVMAHYLLYLLLSCSNCLFTPDCSSSIEGSTITDLFSDFPNTCSGR